MGRSSSSPTRQRGVTSHTASSGKDEKKEGVGVQVVVDEEKEKEETKPDRMMIGFSFGKYPTPGKTPYDYLNDKRKTETEDYKRLGVRVSGTRLVDLRKGIEDAILPPLAIWELGEWWASIDVKDEPFTPKGYQESEVLMECGWVCDGQGVPGNYLYTVYLLPKAVATWQLPKHPMLWTKSQKNGKSSQIFVSSGGWHGQGWQSGPTTTPPKPATPTPTKATSLPSGVRFRCAGCGHWFTDTNLATHARAELCPGLEASGEQDWAVLCDKDCGCHTLDESAKCKPGFPRPKPVVAEKEKEVNMSTVEAPEPEEDAETPEPTPEPSEETETAPETETNEA